MPPRETAVAQDVRPGEVIGELRQQPVDDGGDFLRAAVFSQRHVCGLLGEALLKRLPRLLRPSRDQSGVMLREHAAERDRVDEDAPRPQREGESFRLAEPGGPQDVARRELPEHLHGRDGGDDDDLGAAAFFEVRAHRADRQIEKGEGANETGLKVRAPGV